IVLTSLRKIRMDWPRLFARPGSFGPAKMSTSSTTIAMITKGFSKIARTLRLPTACSRLIAASLLARAPVPPECVRGPGSDGRARRGRRGHGRAGQLGQQAAERARRRDPDLHGHAGLARSALDGDGTVAGGEVLGGGVELDGDERVVAVREECAHGLVEDGHVVLDGTIEDLEPADAVEPEGAHRLPQQAPG